MSLVDHIISGAMLLIVLIAVGTIITSQSVQTTQERIDFRQTSFMLDKHEGSLNTIMSINEPATRQSYARLLARSIYENRDTITLPSGEDVNISDLVDDALQMVYGPGNYYARISPFINDVHIRLVFDGTGSLDHERETIRNNLARIIEETRRAIEDSTGQDNAPRLTFAISIVSPDESLCQPFEAITIEGFEGCMTISKNEAYEHIDEPSISGDLNPYYGLDGNEIYYRGDWAAGMVTSLSRILEEEDPDDDTRSLIIMFPVTDELTTGSIPNECYGAGPDIINPSAHSGITGSTQREELEREILKWNVGYCGMCHDECPLSRSESQIAQLHGFIESHEDLRSRLIVNSVFSEDCDMVYHQDYNDPIPPVQWSGYIDQFIEEGVYDPTDIGSNTYCDFEKCTGCRTNTEDTSRICWRSSCTQDTIDQLESLSDEYRGSFIELDDVTRLPDYITQSVIEAADALVTSYGERRDEDSRYVVTYSILLPNNERVPFTVWIYEDREFDIHIPQIDIRAEPPESWPGQTIRLLSIIETSGGVANVRIALESEDEPIELELLTRASTTYTYYTAPEFDTTGLLDGAYDVAYTVYDTAFNRFEGTVQEVFTIDSNLRPYPELMNEDVILQDVVLENREADAIVGITDNPDAAGVEAVWIEVVDRNGNTERYDLEFTIYWTTSFDVGSIHGTHYVSVFIEDDLGRIRTYTSIDSFEVVERLACESRDTCIDQGAGLTACTGDEQYDYYCSEEQAPEGMFAAERQSCQTGLGWDSNTHECYEPTTTYDFVFVPLRYPDTPQGRSAFTNTVNIIIQGLEQSSPINRCDAELRSTLFKYHISDDFSCSAQEGCVQGSDIDDCLEVTLDCGRAAFPGVGDKFFGISPSRWGTTYGKAGGFGAPNMVTSQQTSKVFTRNIALHEAGHTWHLGHLRTGVPAIGGPCHPGYPNRADCDHPDEIEFLMNYALTRANKRFGPAGYSVIASQLSEQLGYCS